MVVFQANGLRSIFGLTTLWDAWGCLQPMAPQRETLCVAAMSVANVRISYYFRNAACALLFNITFVLCVQHHVQQDWCLFLYSVDATGSGSFWRLLDFSVSTVMKIGKTRVLKTCWTNRQPQCSPLLLYINEQCFCVSSPLHIQYSRGHISILYDCCWRKQPSRSLNGGFPRYLPHASGLGYFEGCCCLVTYLMNWLGSSSSISVNLNWLTVG